MVKIKMLFLSSYWTVKRYKLNWKVTFISSIMSIVPAYLVALYGKNTGKLNLFFVESPREYMEFLIVGILYWSFVELLWSSVFKLRYYMKTGKFEDIFLSPINIFENIIGWSFLDILFSLAQNVLLVTVVLGMQLFKTSILEILTVLIVFVISILGSYGIVLTLFAVSLIIKEGDQLVSLIGNIAPFLCGLYFPISVLPNSLQFISYIFPFTWGIDIIRGILMKTPTITNISMEIIIMTSLSFVITLFGSLLYSSMEKRARKNGVAGY